VNFNDPLTPFHDLKRVADLSAILIRHGFGDLVGRMGLTGTALRAGQSLTASKSATPEGLTPPERLRMALEEMGPTFVKLGQVLSSRIDLLPPAYIAELEKLRDSVPPVSFSALRAEVEAERSHPLTDDFSDIDPVPLGAGSIAQVHHARLHSGAQVILKIRRPGIRTLIEADLRLLMRLADIATAESADIRRFRPHEVVAEFAHSIRCELDLANECRNAERIAANFRDCAHIQVPRVHWEWTSGVMNVQDTVTGVPGTNLEAARRAGLDLRKIAARGADAVLQMMLVDRFFHADPHPGNVFYLPGDQIVFIDFGMVGHISRQRRDELVDLLTGVVERRPDAVTRILLDWAGVGLAANPDLEARIEGFINRVHGLPLKSLNLSALVLDLIAEVRVHDLALPPDLTMLIKVFTTLDGMGRELDPDFDIAAAAQPFLQRLILERYSPARLARNARDGLMAGAGLMNRLPDDLGRLLSAAQKGTLSFGIEIRKMDNLMDRFDRSVTRMTLGVLIAALIMGSSIVMTVVEGELPVGLTIFAMAGFFGAVAGGLWLLWSILRGGKD
jgi:ubiquinone biosynthesis protein